MPSKKSNDQTQDNKDDKSPSKGYMLESKSKVSGSGSKTSSGSGSGRSSRSGKR